MDMDQARLMRMFGVNINAWSQGIDEVLTHRNRLLLIESFFQLPPSRVWFFVKHIRAGLWERSTGLETEIDLGDCLNGPENTIARGKCLLSIF
jgi:hypothetical protein